MKHEVTLTTYSPIEVNGICNGREFSAKFGHSGLIAFNGPGKWTAFPDSLTRGERIAIGRVIRLADTDTTKRPKVNNVTQGTRVN